MSTLTIRRLPDEVHQVLKLRVAHTGRSTEAEVRAIIEAAVMPQMDFADAMLAVGKMIYGLNVEFKRKRRAIRTVSFE
jgi:antitoxin FitA